MLNTTEEGRPNLLSAVLVADPSQSFLEHAIGQARRLAHRMLRANTEGEAIRLMERERPTLVILSFELGKRALNHALGYSKGNSQSLLIATYRELPPSEFERMRKANLGGILPHPVDFTEVFRAVAKRFNVAVRQHGRFPVALDVFRADGVTLGTTQNLSLGGLRLICTGHLNAGDSILADIHLDHATPLRVRCNILEVISDPPSARVQFDNLRGPNLARLAAFLDRLAGGEEEKEAL